MSKKIIPANVKALRAIRVLKGLSRAKAGALLGISARAIEQLENGRANPTMNRIERILKAYGASLEEFNRHKAAPDQALLDAKLFNESARSISRKPRRSCFKVVTKEVRVLRVLRQRRGWSQDEVSLRCGYTRAIYGQIENGRINLGVDRIQHIVKSMIFTMSDFQALMDAEVLRDEIILDCANNLKKLDDKQLVSVRMIIQSMVT